jgi:protein-tyrosine phosphatase
MVRICFVCLGNICRSPTAGGIMLHLVRQAGLDHAIGVESAGTGGWHVGEPADRRAQAVARSRGYALPGQAQQFGRADFARFDHVLAMDRSNRDALHGLARSDDERQKIRLFRAFDPELARGVEADVPDPYYGGPRGFDEVFDMCERTCRNLLDFLCEQHGIAGRGIGRGSP